MIKDGLVAEEVVKQVIKGKSRLLTPREYTEFQRYIGHKTGVFYSILTKNNKL